MNKCWTFTRGLAATVLLAFPCFTGAPAGMAIAQEHDRSLEEVIVTETPIARQHDGSGVGGLPVEFIRLTRSVSYADLDLTSEADVAALMQRIETAAQTSCEELAGRYPVSFTGRWAVKDCIDEAISKAEKQVREAVNAAHG